MVLQDILLILAVIKSGAMVLRIVPPWPTIVPLFASVNVTPHKLFDVPLFSDVQLVPPLVVLRIVPKKPTTIPLFASRKEYAF